MEFDAVDDFLQNVDTDRPLLTGFLQAVEDFEAIERFSPPVFLHHQWKGILRPLTGRKPFMAAEAFPPPSNRVLLLSEAGIDDFTLRMVTERTFHVFECSGWNVESGFYIHPLLSTFYPPSSLEFLNFNSRFLEHLLRQGIWN